MEYAFIVEVPEAIGKEVVAAAEASGGRDIAEAPLDTGELHLNAPDATAIITGAIVVSVIFHSASEVIAFANKLIDTIERAKRIGTVKIKAPRTNRTISTVSYDKLVKDGENERARIINKLVDNDVADFGEDDLSP